MTRGQYSAGLDAALRGAGLPYGYTLSVWASGQVLIDRHGKPSVTAALYVVLGAAAAFALLRLAAVGARATVDATDLAADRRFLRVAALHAATIAAAVGAAALMARVGGAVAWPLGGFAATAVYLGGSAAALALRERAARD